MSQQSPPSAVSVFGWVRAWLPLLSVAAVGVGMYFSSTYQIKENQKDIKEMSKKLDELIKLQGANQLTLGLSTERTRQNKEALMELKASMREINARLSKK